LKPGVQPFRPEVALNDERGKNMGQAAGILLGAVLVLTNDASEDEARKAFERIQKLEGEWDERSTKGWGGVKIVTVIAGGSAVLSTSRIDPHLGENESMATVFHMDGDRLLVTHYCVAGNQPRLVATSIRNQGREIEFSFLDATNLKSPEAGHMHRAVFSLDSDDRYRTRWTFYRDGREEWMEEIVHVRRR
jgi:hypothetical protein